MNALPLVVPAALASVGFAFLALRTRRLHLAGGAIAGLGAGVGSMFFFAGFPGLGVAAMASTWGVSAAAVVIGQMLSAIEERDPGERRGEPWLVALLATVLLSASLALGILAVDWPRGVLPALDPSEPVGRVAAWSLAVLAAAAALALTALIIHPSEES